MGARFSVCGVFELSSSCMEDYHVCVLCVGTQVIGGMLMYLWLCVFIICVHTRCSGIVFVFIVACNS